MIFLTSFEMTISYFYFRRGGRRSRPPLLKSVYISLCHYEQSEEYKTIYRTIVILNQKNSRSDKQDNMVSTSQNYRPSKRVITKSTYISLHFFLISLQFIIISIHISAYSMFYIFFTIVYTIMKIYLCSHQM